MDCNARGESHNWVQNPQTLKWQCNRCGAEI